jgi:hypothetical protein
MRNSTWYVMLNSHYVKCCQTLDENVYMCQFKTGREFTNKRKGFEQQVPV